MSSDFHFLVSENYHKTSSPKGNNRSPESQVFLNSSQVSKSSIFFTWSKAAYSTVHGWTISDVNQGSKLCCKFEKKKTIYNTNVILSMMMCIQNLVLFCQFVLKILSKNQILTSIKGRNSVAICEKQRFTIPT